MDDVLRRLLEHMDLVHLLYGMACILLGTTVLLQPKEGSALRLAKAIWLLAAFGLVMGFKEWMSLWVWFGSDDGIPAAVSALALIASNLFLFEFGRRLVGLSGGGARRRWRHSRSVGLWVYLPIVIGILLTTLVSAHWLRGMDIGARYFLGFPASILTAMGFLIYERAESEGRDDHGAGVRFKVAAAAFCAHGVFGGLIVPSEAFLPPRVINEESFAALTRVPVHCLRALSALLLLFAVNGILRIFHLEVRQKLRSALAQSRRSLLEVRRLSSRNQLILDSAGQGICGLDRAGRLTFVNTCAAELLGCPMEELIGATLHDRVHALRDDGVGCLHTECPILNTIADGIPRHVDSDVFRRADATTFAVEYTGTPIVHGETVVGVVVAFADISRRKDAEKHLRQAALVIENTPDCVVIMDASGLIQSVNPAFLSRTGYTLEDVLGRSPKLLQSGHHPPSFYLTMWQKIVSNGQWQGEIWNRRKNGEIYPEWLSIKVLKDDDLRITNYVAIYSDITTHQEVQARLHHLAYYDPLTGLPNRQLFTDRLGLALAQAQREHNLLGLIFVDLDRFKTINDTLGHGMGDRLLQQVGARLRGAVRQSDTIARIGGDEFTVILPALAQPEDAAAVARKILETLEPPLRIDQQELFVTASLGISLYPADGDTAESLIGRADIAMYRAKESGRNSYQFYRPDMSERFKHRLALESDLRRAVKNEELYFVYQPQFDIRSGRLAGVEALARWRHPEIGDIAPATFIPIAEDIGLIGQIGRWGLKRACCEAREWVGRDDGPFRVAVNLSAHQLQDSELPRFLARAALDAGIRTDSIALELTESVLMDGSPTTESTLRELTDMGVEIAIDDFGTGYSSLSYITRFSIDKLKIDRSFMRQIPGNPNDSAIATMIIAMAHASNMRVTAEGVENRAQLNFLLEQGCDEMQGNFVGIPVPPAEITRMLKRSGRSAPVALPSRGRKLREPRSVHASVIGAGTQT